MHFEHLTLNTGHSNISPSWQCSAQVVEIAMNFLGGVMVPLPSDENPLFLTETGNDQGAVATLYTDLEGSRLPLVEWFTVWNSEDSSTCWNHVKQAKDDFTQMFRNSQFLREVWEASFTTKSVNCPQIVPWAAAILLPHMSLASAVAPLLGDIERVIIWAQLKRAGLCLQENNPTGTPIWN